MLKLFIHRALSTCSFSYAAKTFISESINIEDEEVLKMIRECLDLREKYVFRETTAPWMKESGQDSKMKDDPFVFVPVEATAVSFYSTG